MKKRMIQLVLFAAIIVAAGVMTSRENKKSDISDVALENVEALAGGEGGLGTCFTYCRFDPNYECHVFGGVPSPTYCFYYRAK